MPNRDRVAAIGNVLDFVIPAVVCFGKMWGWADNDISRHLRMYIAEHRNDPRLIEGEGTFFTLRPGSQIVPRFLVSADRGPKDVMLHGVAIQELNCCPLLNCHDMRRKHQSLLVHDWMVLRGRKGLTGNR